MPSRKCSFYSTGASRGQKKTPGGYFTPGADMFELRQLWSAFIESGQSRSDLGSALDAEGAATAAGALDVRVVELEARTFDGLDVVDLHAVEIHLAHLVDENLQAVELINAVRVFIHGVFKGHVVAEARAASAPHRNAQACRR